MTVHQNNHPQSSEIYVISEYHITGSRSTFEFQSRVNLSGPSLYCIARTLGKEIRHLIGLAGARLTRSDFRLNLLLLKVRDIEEFYYFRYWNYTMQWTNSWNKDKDNIYIYRYAGRYKFWGLKKKCDQHHLCRTHSILFSGLLLIYHFVYAW